MRSRRSTLRISLRRYSDSDEERERQELVAAKAPPKAPEPAPVQITRKEREQLEAQKEPEADPEQISKDMERLALIKAKRAKQAADRIEKDGWDKLQPMSEDNHPPGSKWPPPEA
jgi:hypothetical protein